MSEFVGDDPSLRAMNMNYVRDLSVHVTQTHKLKRKNNPKKLV